ncbi:MAG: hypothetical protein B7733_24225 [Myxococcales bacterium FL481]|nr:MAG: hypothetical protein B7733_24225 [Myxococcales bacterium FL481]
MIIFHSPGTDDQESEERVDRYGEHFSASPAAFAFGANQTFATIQESENEWNIQPVNPPDNFMGPTLWPSDLDIFAAVGQAFPPGDQEGSHLDMLHVSPLSMGIAHEADNIYWVFDGKAGNIVRYDFKDDHGPGGWDHRDGVIRRFSDVEVKRVPDVPSHMVMDKSASPRLLYIADTGNSRIMVLDTSSGTNTGPLPGNKDGCSEYSGVSGAEYQVLVDSGLDQPSGIELHDGRLFVSDHATNEIIAYDLAGEELARLETEAEGIMGLAVGPEGHLWYVDGAADQVVRIDP